MNCYIPAPWQRPTHREQRDMLIEACRLENFTPTAGFLDLVQAMTGLESVYGCPDKPAVWIGSCNHGAVQHHYPTCPTARLAGQPWTGQACFAATDTKPQPDGTSKPYGVCFCADPDHVSGIRRVVRWVIKRQAVVNAANTGVPLNYSTALRAAGYYEGWGKTQQDRINNHCTAITKWVNAIHKGLAQEVEEYPEAEGDAFLVMLTAAELIEEARASMLAEAQAAVAETPDGTEP